MAKRLSPAQLEQALAALENANKVRFSGAALKRKVAAGRISVKKALEHPDAQPMRLEALLGSVHRWGPSRIHKLMRRLNLGEMTKHRRVEELTDRQKALIVRGMKRPDYWVEIDD